MKTLTFQLPSELADQFRLYCKLRKREMSELLRDEVAAFIAQHPNTEAEVKYEKLEDWIEGYKQIPGATLAEVLRQLRALDNTQEEG